MRHVFQRNCDAHQLNSRDPGEIALTLSDNKTLEKTTPMPLSSGCKRISGLWRSTHGAVMDEQRKPVGCRRQHGFCRRNC